MNEVETAFELEKLVAVVRVVGGGVLGVVILIPHAHVVVVVAHVVVVLVLVHLLLGLGIVDQAVLVGGHGYVPVARVSEFLHVESFFNDDVLDII